MNEDEAATILVADDEEDIRDIVRYHLEKEGYKVITSKNGEEAIDSLKEYNISVAITDLKMPKVDGFEVLDYIKKYCSFIPAIVITGYVDVEFAVEAMKKGCFDYITKPIKRDELIDVVDNALRKKDSMEDLRPFEILGMYLLNEGGMVLFHKDTVPHSKFDPDVFGSMFIAIKAFIKDSFYLDEGLKYIEHGSLRILVEEGQNIHLVVVGKGDVIEPVRDNMRKAIKSINRRYGEAISNWNGNSEIFNEIGGEFEGLI